jgi:hypothetical protein
MAPGNTHDCTGVARVEVDRLFLEECRDRLRGMIEAIDQEREALSGYFAEHGPHHSDDDCPQDDTCDCPEHQPLSAAWERLGREIELAYRRLDRIKAAIAYLEVRDVA